MNEIDNATQKATAAIVHRWIATEAIRRYLRKLLRWRVDKNLPHDHRSLLEKLDHVRRK